MSDSDRTLMLRCDGVHSLSLVRGETPYSELLEIDVLEDCRRQAQQAIEKLTEDLSDVADSDRLRMDTCWLFTPDYRRPDDLQGVFGALFLVHAAERIAEREPRPPGLRPRLVLGVGVPDWLAPLARSAGFEPLRSASTLRQRLKRIPGVQVCWESLRFLSDHAGHWVRSAALRNVVRSPHPNVLIKMPATGAEARYGPVVARLAEGGWTVRAHDFESEGRSALPTGRWRLFRLLTLGAIVLALSDAFAVRRFLARRAGSAALAASPVFAPSVYALARRLLQLRLWDAALRADPPDAALTVTSLNRPEDRMLIACLNRHAVPVCQVLPRPLNPDRPAERFLSVDLARQDTLPSLFLVRDGQSRTALVEQGVDPDKIVVAVPRLPPTSNAEPTSAPRVRVLVLLTVLDRANSGLLSLMSEMDWSGIDAEILIRCHPGRSLQPAARKALTHLPVLWREDNDSALVDQVGPCTLAVTSTSTAAIDAARSGAAVLWAPFLSDIAIFQRRFMRQIGRSTSTAAEFKQALAELLTDRYALQALAESCAVAAKRQFSADRIVADAVVDWLDAVGSNRPTERATA